jgi:hypothetical protein
MVDLNRKAGHDEYTNHSRRFVPFAIATWYGAGLSRNLIQVRD